MGRLNAVYVSLDCKPSTMDAQAKGKYRGKTCKPLPGPGGDLARSCDEQLADVFRAVKRMVDERELLVGREIANGYKGRTPPMLPPLTTRKRGTWTWSRSDI